MLVPRVLVAVTLARTPLASRWASERWDAVAVLPLADSAAVDEVPAASSSDDGSRWRYAAFAVELHRSEAEGYHLNITAPLPKAFVMLRAAEDGRDPPLRPKLVTVSYNEAARMLDGGEQVDAVPLPPAMLEWLRPFVALHYKPEPKKKMKRNDPFADGAFRRDPGTGH
jgi:hypothetical protein